MLRARGASLAAATASAAPEDGEHAITLSTLRWRHMTERTRPPSTRIVVPVM
jgi:hypothetical protein